MAYPIVCNISKGRVAELVNRVKTNDPANSAIVVIPVDVGSVTETQMRDADTFAAMVALGVTERNANGWTRKTLVDTDLAAVAPDDTNDRMDVDLPDQTWTAVTSGAVTHLVVCYDHDTTAGTDANLIPLTVHDWPVTPAGVDEQVQWATAGFYRAS